MMTTEERLKRCEDELIAQVRAIADFGTLIGDSMRLMGNLEFRIEALESLAIGPLCAELEKLRGRVITAADWARTKMQALAEMHGGLRGGRTDE